jgi:hypothetical protein
MWYQVTIQDLNGIIGTVSVAAVDFESFTEKHNVINVVR